jgi:hypothetical protein
MLRGLFSPLPTAFTERGDLNLDALTRNLQRWNAQPLDGYVVGGSNGEFPLQTREERLQVVRAVATERAPGRLVLGADGVDAATAEMAQAGRGGGAGRHRRHALVPKGATTSALVRTTSPSPTLHNPAGPTTSGQHRSRPGSRAWSISQREHRRPKESSADMVKIGRLTGRRLASQCWPVQPAFPRRWL